MRPSTVSIIVIFFIVVPFLRLETGFNAECISLAYWHFPSPGTVFVYLGIINLPGSECPEVGTVEVNPRTRQFNLALSVLSEQTVLEGIVEADETFFPISYKGNHKKSKFVMPRDPHKRGKAIRIRGLSKEQVCVPCAVDRSGRAYSKITNLGRVSTKDLHNIYDDCIRKNATICTDKMNSYVRFAHSNKLSLIQLKTGKSKKGIYNIQRINSYHSELKGFLRPFKGVSTKYLNNYLKWHNLINMKGNALQDKVDYLLRSSISIVANI